MSDQIQPRPFRDGLWAWVALGVAIMMALVVAPWDTRTSNVAAGAPTSGDALGTTPQTTFPGDTTTLPGDTLDAPSPIALPSGSVGFTPNPGSSQGTGSGAGATVGTFSTGATKDSVTVGFIWLKGQEEAANDLGFSVTPAGDVPGQIKALTKWINKNGGIAGKELKSIVRPIDFRTSSTQTEQDLCTAFVQDDKVFAVILVGQIREVTRSCYTDHKVITFDPSGFPMSQQLYDQDAPYLWSPSYPTISETSVHLPPALKAQGFWNPTGRSTDSCVVAPCNTGVLMFDFPNYHRVLNEQMRPALEKVGITVPDSQVQLVDASDAATIQSGLANAVVQFQARAVTRVLFIGGSPLAPFFMVNAKQQRYTPIYGITSFDQPRFATDPANGKLVGDQIKGAMGIGFTPVLDIFDQDWKHHQPMWDQCVGMYNAAGFTWPDSVGARVPVAYCESILMLRHVAGLTYPSLTADLWAQAASTLHTSMQTATGIGSRFTSANRAGGDLYRYLKYDFDCECFQYHGKNKRL